jgi:hypothetical protein
MLYSISDASREFLGVQTDAAKLLGSVFRAMLYIIQEIFHQSQTKKDSCSMCNSFPRKGSLGTLDSSQLTVNSLLLLFWNLQ